MDGEKARPILQRILARRDAGSACLRQKAVFLIAQGGGEGTEDILLETTRNDPDPEVREQAVFWLSQVGTDKAVDRTRFDSPALHRPPAAGEGPVRAVAAREPRAPGPRCAAMPSAPTCRTSCGRRRSSGSARATTRRAAPSCAASTAGSRVLELRKKLLFSVSQQDTKESRSWLLTVARDATQPMELRKQALFSAGQTGVPVAELGALYDG